MNHSHSSKQRHQVDNTLCVDIVAFTGTEKSFFGDGLFGHDITLM